MKLFGCFIKVVIGLLILLVVFVTVGVLVVDHYAVDVASKVLQQKSGFTLTAGQQSISALSGAGDLHDVTVANPDRFAAKDFLHFNELKLVTEPTSILGKRIIIDEVIVDLDSFAMVYNKDGELNLMALKEGLMGGAAATAAPATPAASGKKSAIPPFTVKKFTLRIKSVKLLDFKHSDGKPQVTQVNYERTFSDVDETNMNKVAVQIGLDLSSKGFSVFSDALKNQILDPNTYLDAAKGIGGAVINGVNNAAQGIGNLVKKVF